MSFVIFGDSYTFPEGNAATNRVHSYAKGIHELGMPVHVIGFLNKFNEIPAGEYNGIKFHNPYNQSVRSKSIFIRTWQKFNKCVKTIQVISKINKDHKIIAINSWTSDAFTYFFGVFLAKIFRAKFLIECSEHPLRFHQGNFINKIRGKIKFYLESRVCDGALCISNYLVDFYKSYNVSNSKLLLLPSTVDTERFGKKIEMSFPYQFVGYFGSLSFERDNVDLLVNAFSEVHIKHPQIKLVLGGFATDTELEELHALINKLNLSEKIIILEYLLRDEVVQYILHAQVLVMVRNSNLESEASYPSKLTEYLSTSIPVISVSMGDIPIYITDRENAFLVEPGNVAQLANQLDYVLSNYDYAKEVGKRGKELTETIFNYKTQSARILAFINTLK